MFVDSVRTKVIAGAGGMGCRSFRREKYVPHGGPNGGDGGNGGDVIFEATSKLTTLMDFRYRQLWKGERGVHGKGSNMHGKNSAPTIVPVPCGTLIKDMETEELLCDLVEEGQQFIAARGGKGGKGNARFVSSTNRAPDFAEKGEPGEEMEYRLELKLIAEVGLVGLPNAGKSTLLSSISAANPKIANYPFTTLSPNLGVVTISDYRTLTVADIPGIIEGAAEGKGLGHDFLRHIERTRVLLFVVDTGDEDPLETLATLENELAEHSALFAERPRYIAFNKLDVTENRERFEELKNSQKQVYGISAATGDGVEPLLEELWQAVDRVKKEEAGIEVPEPEHEYLYEAPFSVEEENGVYIVEGRRILRAIRMTDFENKQAVRHLQDVLEGMGLYKALKRLRVEPGATVRIGEFEMEYQPDS